MASSVTSSQAALPKALPASLLSSLPSLPISSASKSSIPASSLSPSSTPAKSAASPAESPSPRSPVAASAVVSVSSTPSTHLQSHAVTEEELDLEKLSELDMDEAEQIHINSEE